MSGFALTVGVLTALAASAGATVLSGPCGTAGTFSAAGSTASCTYGAGISDTFTAPSNVSSVTIQAVGGKGGAGYAGPASGGPGGYGASVTATLSIAPATQLDVYVGANGGNGGNFGAGAGGAGGVAGAASGGQGGCGTAQDCAGGGGGATTVESSGSTALVIAGGGGGGGGGPSAAGGGAGDNAGGGALHCQGGSAGAPDGTGQGGAAPYASCYASTIYGDNGPGGNGSGGDGGSGGSPAGTGYGTGGGGGGGFNGGGGGQADGQGPGAGGGGGSSYTDVSLTGVTKATDTGGSPLVKITWSLPVPTLNVTQQPSTTTVGGAGIDDKATVSGGQSPTGTVSFYLYDNSTATGTPLYSDTNVALSGGSATSGSYLPTSPGTVYWVATYNGDSSNAAVSSAPAAQPVTVAPASPTLSASVAGSTSDPVGTAFPSADLQADLTGGYAPSGTITFKVFGPLASAPTDCSDGTTVGTATVTATGTYTSSADYTPLALGQYYLYASYGGDTNNNSAGSTCGSGMPTFDVVWASPSLSVTGSATGTVGQSLPASAVSAALTGGYAETGTIRYSVFGPQASAPTDCSSGASAGTATVDGAGSYSPTTGFTPTAAGDYWWYAVYSGDGDNNPAGSACGSLMAETVVGKLSPSLRLTAPTAGTAGSSLSASSIGVAISGGYQPTGTVTFRVVGPQTSAPVSCTGGATVGTATIAGNGSYDSSSGFTPSQAGDYWWYASYGGDGNNTEGESRCGSLMAETVVAAASSNTGSGTGTGAGAGTGTGGGTGAGAGSGTGSGTGTSTGPTTIATALAPTPVVSSLRISRLASERGRAVKGRCVAPSSHAKGSRSCSRTLEFKVSYKLNTAASVTFTVERLAVGHRSGGRCVAAAARKHRTARCTLLVRVPGSVTEPAAAGANSFVLKGRIGGRELGAGSYELIATPAGTASAAKVRFKVAG